MATLEQIKLGICRFVDCEIMSKVSGLSKWFIGASITSIPQVIHNKYNDMKPLLVEMGIVDSSDCIDMAKAEQMLLTSCSKYGNAEMDIAGLKVTLNSDDIRKAVAYIKQM